MGHTIKIILHSPAAFHSPCSTDARELAASFQSEQINVKGNYM